MLIPLANALKMAIISSIRHISNWTQTMFEMLNAKLVRCRSAVTAANVSTCCAWSLSVP